MKNQSKHTSCRAKIWHTINVIFYLIRTGNFFSRLSTIIYRQLKPIWMKIRHYCKLCRRARNLFQHTFAKTTFLLCIRPKKHPFPFLPKRFRKKPTLAKPFPPPGYGVPPGYDDVIKEHNYKTKQEYGLYLFPGRINAAFGFLTLLLGALLFMPLINGTAYAYGLMIVIYFYLGLFIYRLLFNRIIPASLSQVWEKWPIPAYELFLSVPHTISVSWHDRFTPIKKSSNNHGGYQQPKPYIFWNPDTKTPMWRQSTENSPDMHTLQELILNLAVFEFLFHRNNHKTTQQTLEPEQDPSETKQSLIRKMVPSVESIHEYHWYFFLFSPIFINLFLILFTIFFFATLSGTTVNCETPNIITIFFTEKSSSCSPEQQINILGFRLLFHFPYNVVIAVLTWFLFTIFYVGWILKTLTDLSKKIRQNYFNAHLDLIPQQILNELSYIPTQQQVDNGITYVKTILNWSSGIVFIGLMAVLEIFSQSASRDHIDYGMEEGLKSLAVHIKNFIIGG